MTLEQATKLEIMQAKGYAYVKRSGDVICVVRGSDCRAIRLDGSETRWTPKGKRK